MDRTFASGASATPPSAPASPSSGYPTKGNSGTGTPATKPGEYWYYMITEEIRKAIVDAGLTPSHTNLGQLSQAIQTMAVIADASTTVKGKVQLATSAEAQALTNALNALTPATLAAALKGSNQLLATSGYQKLPGGVVLQWGLDTLALAPGANRDVTYPVAFPSGVGYVDVSVHSLSVNNQANVPLVLVPGVGGLTKFNVTNTDIDSSITTFRWFALGW